MLDEDVDFDIIPIKDRATHSAWHNEALYSIKIKYRGEVYWKCLYEGCNRVSPYESRRAFGNHFFKDHKVPESHKDGKTSYSKAPPLHRDSKELESLIKPSPGLIQYCIHFNKSPHSLAHFDQFNYQNTVQSNALVQLTPPQETDLALILLFSQQNTVLISLLDKIPLVSLICYYIRSEYTDFLCINVHFSLDIFTSKSVTIGLINLAEESIVSLTQYFIEALDSVGIKTKVYTITIDDSERFYPLAMAFKDACPDTLFEVANLFPCLGLFISKEVQSLVNTLSHNPNFNILDKLRDGKEYIR